MLVIKTLGVFCSVLIMATLLLDFTDAAPPRQRGKPPGARRSFGSFISQFRPNGPPPSIYGRPPPPPFGYRPNGSPPSSYMRPPPPPFGYHPNGPPPSTSQGHHGCPHTTPAQNKKLAIRFNTLVLNQKDFTQAAQLMTENYIEHNPNEKSGRQNFLETIPHVLEKTPKNSWEFKRAIAEGNLVWIHSKLPIQGKEFVLSDTFRIQCGKIAEHWDVAQEYKRDVPNPIAYF